MRKVISLLLLFLLSATTLFASGNDVKKYTKALKANYKAPQDYALEKIKQHDLLIFDDANHAALEPFLFYQDLLKNDTFRQNIDYVFIEIFAINNQKHLDSFLEAPQLDIQLLAPVFRTI